MAVLSSVSVQSVAGVSIVVIYAVLAARLGLKAAVILRAHGRRLYAVPFDLPIA